MQSAFALPKREVCWFIFRLLTVFRSCLTCLSCLSCLSCSGSDSCFPLKFSLFSAAGCGFVFGISICFDCVCYSGNNWLKCCKCNLLTKFDFFDIISLCLFAQI